MSRILMFVQKYKSKIKDIGKGIKRGSLHIFFCLSRGSIFTDFWFTPLSQVLIMFGRKEKTTCLLGIL